LIGWLVGINSLAVENWTIAVNAEGTHVATGAQSGNINVFEIESGQKVDNFFSTSICLFVRF
jgi:hypothetical protein